MATERLLKALTNPEEVARIIEETENFFEVKLEEGFSSHEATSSKADSSNFSEDNTKNKCSIM